jgi:Cysteine rich repeat
MDLLMQAAAPRHTRRSKDIISMDHRTVSALVLSMGALIAVSAGVFAQSVTPPAPATGGNPMTACRNDMKALCGDIQPGGGARRQCLVENRAKASPECQAAMASIQDRAAQRATAKGDKAERRGRFAACRADVANLCPEATKGGGRAQCLKQNEAQLSPECGAVVKQITDDRKSGAKQAREACRSDAAALCSTAEKGGATMRCLRENEAKVSPGCGQALANLPLRKRDRAIPSVTPTDSPGVIPAAPPTAPKSQ